MDTQEFMFAQYTGQIPNAGPQRDLRQMGLRLDTNAPVPEQPLFDQINTSLELSNHIYARPTMTAWQWETSLLSYSELHHLRQQPCDSTMDRRLLALTGDWLRTLSRMHHLEIAGVPNIAGRQDCQPFAGLHHMVLTMHDIVHSFALYIPAARERDRVTVHPGVPRSDIAQSRWAISTLASHGFGAWLEHVAEHRTEPYSSSLSYYFLFDRHSSILGWAQATESWGLVPRLSLDLIYPQPHRTQEFPRTHDTVEGPGAEVPETSYEHPYPDAYYSEASSATSSYESDIDSGSNSGSDTSDEDNSSEADSTSDSNGDNNDVLNVVLNVVLRTTQTQLPSSLPLLPPGQPRQHMFPNPSPNVSDIGIYPLPPPPPSPRQYITPEPDSDEEQDQSTGDYNHNNDSDDFYERYWSDSSYRYYYCRFDGRHHFGIRFNRYFQRWFINGHIIDVYHVENHRRENTAIADQGSNNYDDENDILDMHLELPLPEVLNEMPEFVLVFTNTNNYCLGLPPAYEEPPSYDADVPPPLYSS
ncbi:hypothetical protein F5X99DRAFT_48884 [Biscogniauxia marginata]|nr:hypothetical protein F5X99DRAFT_48884 [Biscogniauxia marginata]